MALCVYVRCAKENLKCIQLRTHTPQHRHFNCAITNETYTLYIAVAKTSAVRQCYVTYQTHHSLDYERSGYRNVHTTIHLIRHGISRWRPFWQGRAEAIWSLVVERFSQK